MRTCVDCGALTRRTRCPDCQRTREHARGTRQQRGYGPEHTRLRRDYQARMNRGEPFTCWRCGDPIDPEHWMLGHDDNDRTTWRGPECIPCNCATAGRR